MSLVCEGATMSERSRKRVWIIRLSVMLFLFFVWCAATFEIIRVYGYESSDRGFSEVECPAKGRSLQTVERQFEKYKEWKGDSSVVLCRTRQIPWWDPWEWYGVVTHRRWRLPYMTRSKNSKHNYDYLYPKPNVEPEAKSE